MPLQFNIIPKQGDQQHGERRSIMLRLAIKSSALNKVFALGLQSIAIPVVYKSLGPHWYELYLLLTAALATIALAQMGAGPGLTQGIARANAAGNTSEEATLFSAAFRLALIAVMVAGSFLLALIHLVPPQRLFGTPFMHDRTLILGVADLCVFVLVAQIVAGVVDSALAGYQEQVLSNIAMMFVNAFSIVALLLVCKFSPSISHVILVMYGIPIFASLTNILFLFKRRPYLFNKLLQSCRGGYGMLLHVGLAFWAMQLASVVEQFGGTYVLAHLSSTEATNLFSIAYKGTLLASSVVVLLTYPLWPAFTDAIARKDIEWITRSYMRIRRILTIYSCSFGVTLAVAGHGFCQRILHIDPGHNFILFILMGVYFVANVWTHLFYVTMMGMDVIKKAAAVAVCENLLVLLFGVLLVPHFGSSGMAFAYLAASVALPAWLLPRMMRTALLKVTAESKLPVSPEEDFA